MTDKTPDEITERPASHYDQAVALADQAVRARDDVERHHELIAEARLHLELHDREQVALARMEQTSEQTLAVLEQQRALTKAVRALLDRARWGTPSRSEVPTNALATLAELVGWQRPNLPVVVPPTDAPSARVPVPELRDLQLAVRTFTERALEVSAIAGYVRVERDQVLALHLAAGPRAGRDLATERRCSQVLADLQGAAKELLQLLDPTGVARDETVGHAIDRVDQLAHRTVTA